MASSRSILEPAGPFSATQEQFLVFLPGKTNTESQKVKKTTDCNEQMNLWDRSLFILDTSKACRISSNPCRHCLARLKELSYHKLQRQLHTVSYRETFLTARLARIISDFYLFICLAWTSPKVPEKHEVNVVLIMKQLILLQEATENPRFSCAYPVRPKDLRSKTYV